MQRIRGKGICQAMVVMNITWLLSSVFCKGLLKALLVKPHGCQLGEHLIHLPNMYCQLFHCEFSHHGTSVKVQNVCNGTGC